MKSIHRHKNAKQESEKETFVFILSNEISFFQLFSGFLAKCGFEEEADVFGMYVFRDIDISGFENSVQQFRNNDWNIHVLYKIDRIMLFVTAKLKNKEKLLSWIKEMTR
ncbi:MAG: hypothetical protein V1659_02155 [Candidatus Woesearchaeota archaeon]